jgi:hypothetical protein
MMTNSNASTDAIRTASMAKGFTDVSVVSQRVSDRPGVLDVGAWLVLSVKRQADGDWELLGRRRTEEELLAVIERQQISA